MLRFEARGLRVNSALLGCWLLLLFFLPFTWVRHRRARATTALPVASSLYTCSSMICLSGQMSFWANVFWANVFLGKRPSEQTSFWANVFWANVFQGKSLSGQTSSGQTSYGQMSIWANVFLGKCLLGRCLLGKCRSGQMSMGKCLWANVGWANVGSPCLSRRRKHSRRWNVLIGHQVARKNHLLDPV
jgi:hypothetical protein